MFTYIVCHYMNLLKSIILTFSLLFIDLQAQNVELRFVGDAMLHSRQLDIALKNGKYSFESYFTDLIPLLDKSDINIVNLELALGGPPYTGYPCFSGPDEFAVSLKKSGFNVFLNANNHTLDRGTTGARRTIRVLDSLQISHAGIYLSNKEREEQYPLIIQKNDIRIALLNYTYGTNGAKARAGFIVNYIDTLQIKADIIESRKRNADIIIANIHWGIEYRLLPDKQQKQLANWLIDQGVMAVIGSHPHVIQPIEFIRNKHNQACIIAYSLGNFVSAMSKENTSCGLMLRLSVSKGIVNTQIDSCSYRLLYTKRFARNQTPVFEVKDLSSTLPPDSMFSTYQLHLVKTDLKTIRKLLKENNIGITEEKER